MTDPRTRILFMLASLDSTPGETHRLLRWLQEIGPDRVTMIVEKIRNEMGDIRDIAVGISKQPSPRHEAAIDRDTLARLESFLLSETGLTKRDAVRLVLKEIQTLRGSTSDLPKYDKISLGTWWRGLVVESALTQCFRSQAAFATVLSTKGALTGH